MCFLLISIYVTGFFMMYTSWFFEPNRRGRSLPWRYIAFWFYFTLKPWVQYLYWRRKAKQGDLSFLDKKE